MATPSSENMLDDDDGTPLIQRLDNTPEAVERALSEYEANHGRVVEHYETRCALDTVRRESPTKLQTRVAAEAAAAKLLARVDAVGSMDEVVGRVWNQIH